MNKPLRRVSVFCLALIRRADGLGHLAPGREGRATTRRTRTIRGWRSASTRRRWATSSSTGEPVTGSAATPSTLKYKRTYKDGPLYAPVTGFTSQIFGSNQLENLNGDLLDGSDSRLQSPADALTRTAGQGRRRGHHHRLQGAEGRLPRRSATRRAPPSPWTRPPGGSWAWSAPRRTTRGSSPAPAAPTRRPGRTMSDDAGPPRGQPGAAAAAAARLHLQAGGRRGRAGGRAVLLGGRAHPQPRPVHPPAHPHQAHQRERLRALQERGHPHRAPVLLQHRLREDGRRPGQGQGEGAGREVRLQRRARWTPRCGPARASTPPTWTRRRPRCPGSASSTTRRPRCRWRWSPRPSPTAAS